MIFQTEELNVKTIQSCDLQILTFSLILVLLQQHQFVPHH